MIYANERLISAQIGPTGFLAPKQGKIDLQYSKIIAKLSLKRKRTYDTTLTRIRQFPPAIDDYMTNGNPIRVVDAFSDFFDIVNRGRGRRPLPSE